VRRAPALVRRLLPHRLALAAAAATVMLAATMLAAFASFSATVSSHAVRTSLAGNSGTTISVNGSVSSAAGAARAGSKVAASLRTALPGVPVTVWTAVSSGYLDIPRGLGLPNGETHLISLAALPRHAVLLSGSWPGSGGPPTSPSPSDAAAIPAVAPLAVARGLHLAPGTTIKLHDSISGTLVSVRITGIFRLLSPASPYWLLGSASGGVQLSGGFAEYGPLVISPAVMAGGRIPVASAAWSASPDVSKFGTGGLQALASRVQSGLNRLSQLPGAQNVTVSTGLPGLLSGLGTALVVARSQLAIGATILLVIAGATLALATMMLSSQRQAETALMRSRGASRWQLTGSGLAEAGLLILPAVIAGPLLGGLLLPPLARRGPLGHAGLRLPVTFPASAWLAAAAVAAGCGVVIALPWLRAARSPVGERAQRGRRGALAAVSRAGADLALLLLAVLAGWQLEHYAAPVSTGLDGAIGVDPVLVGAPVLALAAGAVVLLRLLPLVVRLGDRAAARGRDLTAVAAWQISRRPLRQAGPVLLAVLAVATSVLAVAQWTSWQRSAQDQASFATGADVRVDLPPAAPLALGQVASVTRARGVTGATPVVRSTIVLPTSGTATLLALDARSAGSVATIRPDLTGGSPGSLLSRLAPSGPTPGALIPGRPAELAITARLSAGSASQAELFVQLTDAFGISYSEQVGLLPASGAARTLTVVIAPGHGAAYPLRITGFSLQYNMPSQTVPDAVLAIESVRGAASVRGRFGAPSAAAVPGGRMRFSTTAGSGQVTASPKVTGVTVHGTALSVTFQPGAGISPAQFGSPATSLPASLTVSAAGPAGPLPVAATRAFAAATGQGRGSTFPISIDGTSLRVSVVSVISGFPTIEGASGGLVVDQARLQQALAAVGAQPQPVAEWWLSTDPAAAPTGLPGRAAVTDRASLASSLLANPLGAAPELAMLAIAAAAVILAAAGFTVAAATAGERSRDIALLATLGATRRQLTRLLCLEQAALGVPAAAAGLLLGVTAARLVVPAVTLTATGGHPQPAVLVQIPMAWPVAVAVVTAAVPVVIAALGPGRRTGLAARTPLIRVEAET
jgi:FtsX-like permease family